MRHAILSWTMALACVLRCRTMQAILAIPAVAAINSMAGECHDNCATELTFGRSPLDQARALDPPAAVGTEASEFEAADFWESNAALLREAWTEFGLENSTLDNFLDEFIDGDIRRVLQAARTAPTADAEAAIRALWEEVIPGVFRCRLLTPAFISRLRLELDRAEYSGIPKRRPNGMNRHGMILADVPGSAYALRRVVDGLVDRFVRPLALMLFASHSRHEDICDSFAFTINYHQTKDVALREHRDASTITLNVNLNPYRGPSYSGSGLEFVDEADPQVRRTIQFEPGVALLHKGGHRHAAQPLTDGSRTNLVVWLFGDNGYVRAAPYPADEQHTLLERWAPSLSCAAEQRTSPFVLS